MLKHPIDAIYYIKIGKRGSLLSAGIMIIITFVIYMADILGRGFIFNENGPISYDNNSGDGYATLLENIHYGFYNLNTKMVETSETYESDINKALIQLSNNLEFVK